MYLHKMIMHCISIISHEKISKAGDISHIYDYLYIDNSSVTVPMILVSVHKWLLHYHFTHLTTRSLSSAASHFNREFIYFVQYI